MRLLLLTLMSINSLTLFGQTLEISGGLNYNVFHNYPDDVRYRSYTPDYGFAAGIAIDSINIDWLTMRFTLQLDKYRGKLEVSSGGLGSGNTTKAKIDKTVITLGFFPLNFRFFNRIDFNLGFDISGLIHELFSGTVSGWTTWQPSWSYDLREKYDRVSNLIYFGLKARIAYDLFLTKSIIITPQYSYYFGLSGEFKELPGEIKSMRHYSCIGIKKKF